MGGPIEELSALLSSGDVSPAPWSARAGAGRRATLVVHTHGYDGPRDGSDEYDVCDTSESSADGDAALIAALRNAAPALLAELGELRSALRALAEAVPLGVAGIEAPWAPQLRRARALLDGWAPELGELSRGPETSDVSVAVTTTVEELVRAPDAHAESDPRGHRE